MRWVSRNLLKLVELNLRPLLVLAVGTHLAVTLPARAESPPTIGTFGDSWMQLRSAQLVSGTIGGSQVSKIAVYQVHIDLVDNPPALPQPGRTARSLELSLPKESNWRFCGWKWSAGPSLNGPSSWSITVSQDLNGFKGYIVANTSAGKGRAWVDGFLMYRFVDRNIVSGQINCNSDGFMMQSASQMRDNPLQTLPPRSDGQCSCAGPVLICGGSPVGICSTTGRF